MGASTVLVGMRGTLATAAALALVGGAVAIAQHRIGLSLGGAALIAAATAGRSQAGQLPMENRGDGSNLPYNQPI